MIKLARSCGCPAENGPSDASEEPPAEEECEEICETCGFVIKDDCEDECKREPIVVSEIAQSGQPYKEIQVSVNNNLVVLRMQREPLKSEFQPLCECPDQSKNPPGVSFKTVDTTPNRTLSVFPTPEPVEVAPPPSPDDADPKKEKKVVPPPPPKIVIEENPNIFVLRIKRKSDNFDRKHSLDFEFKTPQPWKLSIPEEPKEKVNKC